MPTNGGGWFGRRPAQTESSRSGLEDNVKKPLQIMLWSGPVILLVWTLVWGAISLVWYRFGVKSLNRFWKKNWVCCPAGPMLLWAMAGTILFLRWAVENWNEKWAPPYEALDPHEGLVGPLWGFLQSFRGLRRVFREDRRARAYRGAFEEESESEFE